MTQRPPEATDEDLVAVAEELMQTHGSTTTLDVKEALRQRGFWAVQDDVSPRMRDLSRARGWQCRANGLHRVYALPDDLDEQLLKLLGGSTVH